MSKATRERTAARKAAALETKTATAPQPTAEPIAAAQPVVDNDIAPGLPGGPPLPKATPATPRHVNSGSGALTSAGKAIPAPADPMRQMPVRNLIIGARAMVAGIQLEPNGQAVRILRLTRRDEMIDVLIADDLCEILIESLVRSRSLNKTTPKAEA